MSSLQDGDGKDTPLVTFQQWLGSTNNKTPTYLERVSLSAQYYIERAGMDSLEDLAKTQVFTWRQNETYPLLSRDCSKDRVVLECLWQDYEMVQKKLGTMPVQDKHRQHNWSRNGLKRMFQTDVNDFLLCYHVSHQSGMSKLSSDIFAFFYGATSRRKFYECIVQLMLCWEEAKGMKEAASNPSEYYRALREVKDMIGETEEEGNAEDMQRLRSQLNDKSSPTYMMATVLNLVEDDREGKEEYVPLVERTAALLKVKSYLKNRKRNASKRKFREAAGIPKNKTTKTKKKKGDKRARVAKESGRSDKSDADSVISDKHTTGASSEDESTQDGSVQSEVSPVRETFFEDCYNDSPCLAEQNIDDPASFDGAIVVERTVSGATIADRESFVSPLNNGKISHLLCMETDPNGMLYTFQGLKRDYHAMVPLQTAHQYVSKAFEQGLSSTIIRKSPVMQTASNMATVLYSNSNEYKSLFASVRIDLQEVATLCLKGAHRTGGPTESFGCQHANQNGPREFLPKPNFRTMESANWSPEVRRGTGQLLDSMFAYLLRVYKDSNPPPFYDSRRASIFETEYTTDSGVKSSRFEAHTWVLTELPYEAVDTETEKGTALRLNRHVDTGNDDDTPGYNFGATWSQVIMYNGPVHAFRGRHIRLSLPAYSRESQGWYSQRQHGYGDVIRLKVEQYCAIPGVLHYDMFCLRDNDNWELQPCGMKFPGDVEIADWEGHVPCLRIRWTPAHVDRCALFSAAAYLCRRLKDRYKLDTDLKRAELVLLFSRINSPLKPWYIMEEVWANEEGVDLMALPTGGIIRKYVADCERYWSHCMGGKWQRFAVVASKEDFWHDGEKLVCAVEDMCDIVFQKATKLSAVDSWELLQDTIPDMGPVTANSVFPIAVLSGFSDLLEHATVECMSKGAKHFDMLVRLGCDTPERMSRLIHTIMEQKKMTNAMVVNVLCEQSRRFAGKDVFVYGQSLFRLHNYIDEITGDLRWEVQEKVFQGTEWRPAK